MKPKELINLLAIGVDLFPDTDIQIEAVNRRVDLVGTDKTIYYQIQTDSGNTWCRIDKLPKEKIKILKESNHNSRIDQVIRKAQEENETSHS